MKVCVALVLCLVLWDGCPSLTRAETVEAAEGGNITVVTSFYFSGSRKVFCKNDCNNNEDILVETSGDRGRKGRYSIQYEDTGFSDAKVMYVSITKVSKSDLGRYQCVVATPFKSVHQDFWIKVTNETTNSHPVYTLGPALITSYYQTTTESLTRGPISSETSRAPELITTASANIFLLLLLLIPVVMIVSALIIYRKRKSQNDHNSNQISESVVYENDPAAASEHADSTYQSLSVDTRDHNQIYSSLSPQHSSHSVD